MKTNVNRIETPVETISLELTLDEAKAVTHLLGKSKHGFCVAAGIISTDYIYNGLLDIIREIDPKFNSSRGIEYQLQKREQ